MDAGTEITFWYHSPDGHGANGTKALQGKLNNWGFICECSLCLDSKTTASSTVTKRQELMRRLKRAFDDIRGVQTGSVERILDELNGTYTRPAEKVPRLLLWDPQLALTSVYAERNQATKTLKSAAKVLESLGFILAGVDSSSREFTVVKWGLVMDRLVEAFLLLRTAFAATAADEKARRAEMYARTTFKIVVGEETSFERIYA